MLEPLEPVVALGFGKGNDRERLQVELPTIEHYEAPTYFKIARLGRLFQFRFSKLENLHLLYTTVEIFALFPSPHLLDLPVVDDYYESLPFANVKYTFLFSDPH